MPSFVIPVRIDAKGVTKGLNNISSKFKTLGRNLTLGVTLPLAGIATAASRMALTFDESLTKINTLVGVSKSEIQGMRSEVMKIAGATAQAPNELADALFTVTSAGLRGKEAMQVLEMAAKGSASGLGETKTVAQALTGIMQSYAKSGMTASQATDILTATVRAGNLEASELAPVLGRVTGIASQLGIGFDEVGASIATFTRLGVNSAEAVTGLSGIMNGLVKPTDQTRDALATLNMSMDGLRESIKEKGLAATLVDLVAQVGDNQDVIGELIPNVRALSAVLGTAGAQGEDYVKVANEISNSTGLANQVFEDTAKSSAFQFKQSLNQLAVVGTEIGSMLLPPLVKAAKFVGDLVKGFMSLDGTTKTLVIGLAAVAAAAGPLITAFGLLMSPIGLIIAGITALGVIVYKNFNSIISFVTSVINSFITLYNTTLTVRLGFEGIKFIAKSVFGFLKLQLTNAISIFKNLGLIIKLVFQRRFSEIPDLVKQAFTTVKDDTKEFGQDVAENFKDGLENTLTGTLQHVTEEGIKKGLGNAVDNSLDFVKGVATKITSAMGIGMGGGGDTDTGEGEGEVKGPTETVADSIEKGTEKTENAFKKFFNGFDLNKEKLGNLTNELNSAIQQGIGNMIGGIAVAIGTGSNVMNAFLEMMGGFMVDMGKMFIQFGVAQFTFIQTLKKANPFLLIAAGAALVAIGSMIRSRMAKKASGGDSGGGGGSSRGVTAFADGGIVTGPTLGLVGEAGPEAIIPLDRLGSVMGQQKGEFVLRGTDLVLAMDRAQNFKSRITG